MERKNILGAVAVVFVLAAAATMIWFFAQQPTIDKQQAVVPQASEESDDEEGTHYLGILPLENPSVMLERFSRVENYLRKETGMNIKLRIYPTSGAVGGYTALVRDIVNKNISFAYLAPVTIVQANGVSGGAVVPFACAEKQGSPIYYGHIAVRADSSYEKVEDLKGKPVCGANKSSTSGNLMPTAYLLSKGIDKYEYFVPFDFLGSHDKAAEAVIAGVWDAAFINETTFDKFNAQSEQLKSVYRHPAVPEFPFCVNTDKITSAELESVKSALLRMHETDLDGVKAVDAKFDKWVEINWEDYLVTKESVDVVYGSVFYDLEEWSKSETEN